MCAGLLSFTGCAATTQPESQTTPQVTEASTQHTQRPHKTVPSTPRTTSAHTTHPSSTPAASPGLSKVLVFVVENHSLNQMRTEMPYTFSLAERYGYTTSYRALTHPSLGNYIAMAGGSTFGIADDRNPVAHQLHGPSVFSQALDVGKTASVYAEGMPKPCAQENGGDQYVVRHNPWTYFVDDRPACSRYDVPATRLPQDIANRMLPNIGMVIPNLCNDAHSCSLATADAWLRTAVDAVLAGPDWRSGNWPS